MACPSNNPCCCVGTYTAPTPQSTCSDCLELGHIFVPAASSVGPCSETGTIALTCFDYCACDPTIPTVVVVENSHEGLVTIDSIDSTQITVTTTDVSLAGEVVILTLRITCGGLGAYSTVTIVIQDPCEGVFCDPGDECDSCDGTCNPEAIDIIVT